MARKVVILCGVSGAGKSTHTAAFYSNAFVVSADHYFEDQEGNYHFNPSKLGAAHAECLQLFVEELRVSDRDIVVDNTNTTVAEIAPYAACALAYGYDLEIIILHCKPEVAAARNTHGVPLKRIQGMARRIKKLRDSLPPWWPVTEIKQ